MKARNEDVPELRSFLKNKDQHGAPPEPRYLTAVELKEPNPAPRDNGAIEEKPRPYARIPPLIRKSR
jgi:hypothetical protein